MENLITLETLQKDLVLLTLNRPERRNALCIAMLDELCQQIESLTAKKATRVLIIAGAGPVFCSGMDLSEASQANLVHQCASSLAKTFELMRSTELVTIAAAHGGAYAGGAGLMVSCDLAIGTTDLKIGFPEARRGLLPALICAVMSPKVREGDLRELYLVGNTIDANRAQQMGLLQRIVSQEVLLKTAIELAEGVLAGGVQTVKATKMLLNQAYATRESASIARMLELQLNARHGGEAAEGLAAFLEKRLPNWAAPDA